MQEGPIPPAEFNRLALPLLGFSTAKWHRIFRTRFGPAGALNFGKGRFRFNSPTGTYGVLYAAMTVNGAVAETLLRNPTPLAPVIFAGLLMERSIGVLHSNGLTLVDLTGKGLLVVGAHGNLTTGNYDLSREWSKAIHAHPDRPDGILYRSAHDPDCLCAAIFERARSKLRLEKLIPLDSKSGKILIRDVLSHYGYGISRTQ